jgi:medium-chain acyl-[acyl-carrier-protein] hydrolase
MSQGRITTSTSNIDPWVIYPKPQPQARLRLFCFPYAGGGASIFRSWPEGLPDEIEVCAVQLPGRERRLREPPETRLAPLVDALAHALRPTMHLPFALFGHSMGALIAFDLARRLRQQGGPRPLQVFISARRAAHLPSTDPPIHQLPTAAFLEQLQQRYNAIPPAVLAEKELMDLFLPTLRADFAIHETYVYQADAPLSCPLAAFGGLQDRRVDRDSLEAWGEQTRNRFSLRMFPGDHFFLQSARGQLLQALCEDLTALVRQLP